MSFKITSLQGKKRMVINQSAARARHGRGKEKSPSIGYSDARGGNYLRRGRKMSSCERIIFFWSSGRIAFQNFLQQSFVICLSKILRKNVTSDDAATNLARYGVRYDLGVSLRSSQTVSKSLHNVLKALSYTLKALG